MIYEICNEWRRSELIGRSFAHFLQFSRFCGFRVGTGSLDGIFTLDIAHHLFLIIKIIVLINLSCTLDFVCQQIILYKTMMYPIGDPIYIKAETISSRVQLPSIPTLHAIMSWGQIRDACSKTLRQNSSIEYYNPPLFIHIKLCGR